MTAVVEKKYQANYDLIAHDHLAAGAAQGRNPWQPAACVIANTAITSGVIRHQVPLGASVLDIGCGPGDLLNTMPDYNRTGLDISADYIKLVQGKGIEGVIGNAERLPFENGTFDCVVCADVLEHVLDLNAAVGESLRVLKSGGSLIVRVPHEEDLSPYLSSEYEYVHLRRFDEPTLQLLFGRVFRGVTVTLMFEYTVATEGTLSKEIVCAVRRVTF